MIIRKISAIVAGVLLSAFCGAEEKLYTITPYYQFSEGLSAYYDASSGLFGYMDRTGKPVIAPAFSEPRPFNCGAASIYRHSSGGEKKKAVIDKTGALLFEPEALGYSFLFKYSEGYASVDISGDRTAFIDVKGKIAQTFPYLSLGDLSEGLAVFGTTDAKGERIFGYVDAKGREVIPPRFSSANDFAEGRAYVSLKDSMGDENDFFIDKSGVKVLDLTITCNSYSDGLFRINAHNDRMDPLFLFYDLRGKRAMTASGYVWVDDFHEGRAIAQGPFFYGFIDKSGKEVVKVAYKNVSKYSEGLAAVEIDGKVGFIDKDGKTVLPPTWPAYAPLN